MKRIRKAANTQAFWDRDRVGFRWFVCADWRFAHWGREPSIWIVIDLHSSMAASAEAASGSADANVVALEGFDEGFGHFVAFFRLE
jgi:hypothetical protein